MTISRRDFLRLSLATGAALGLAPLLKACGRPSPAAPTATSPPGPGRLPDLQGLGIDDFFQKAYRRWLARDPETLTSLGLADDFGVGDDRLTDVSDEFIRQTQALEAGTLDILRAYDRASFTPSQALTADIYAWFLDDLVRGHPFLYDDYLINPIVTSGHYNLNLLFTVYHPLENAQDAEDYIARLSQVGLKVEQWIDGLRRREAHGVILPAFMIPIVLPDIRAGAGASPAAHPFYTTFTERLAGVVAEEREALADRVEAQVQDTVLPAYRQLADFLEDQQARAPDAVGVWQFPDGEAYYLQSLRRQTTTEMTADEIHELGQQHVERIQAEMRPLFSALGFSDSESIPRLYAQLAGQSGVYAGAQAVEAYEQAIREAQAFLPQAFDRLPRTEVAVVGGTEGDYYMPAPYDGSRPGLFYARTTGGTPRFGVKSLAYHETIPGHHLQIALAQEIPGLPDLRRGMQFNAYTEGWALYAERLMWELGAYAGDPAGDLGRLRMEAFRAARLVVDTGLHARRWGFDRAVEYLAQATGFPTGYCQAEVTRYCVWPGQATAYYVGFLKLLDLRQKATQAMGGRFDPKAFHRVVLENGSMPLSIVESVVDRYIEGAA